MALLLRIELSIGPTWEQITSAGSSAHPRPTEPESKFEQDLCYSWVHPSLGRGPGGPLLLEVLGRDPYFCNKQVLPISCHHTEQLIKPLSQKEEPNFRIKVCEL